MLASYLGLFSSFFLWGKKPGGGGGSLTKGGGGRDCGEVREKGKGGRDIKREGENSCTSSERVGVGGVVAGFQIWCCHASPPAARLPFFTLKLSNKTASCRTLFLQPLVWHHWRLSAV